MVMRHSVRRVSRRGFSSSTKKKVVMPERTSSEMPNKRLALATELAGFRSQHDGGTGAVSVPIFQTSTFDCADQNQFDYTRSGNPTRDALEELCARIDHASSAFAFTSGMAALTAVLRLLRPGETVLASSDIYEFVKSGSGCCGQGRWDLVPGIFS